MKEVRSEGHANWHPIWVNDCRASRELIWFGIIFPLSLNASHQSIVYSLMSFCGMCAINSEGRVVSPDTNKQHPKIDFSLSRFLLSGASGYTYLFSFCRICIEICTKSDGKFFFRRAERIDLLQFFALIRSQLRRNPVKLHIPISFEVPKQSNSLMPGEIMRFAQPIPPHLRLLKVLKLFSEMP